MNCALCPEEAEKVAQQAALNEARLNEFAEAKQRVRRGEHCTDN